MERVAWPNSFEAVWYMGSAARIVGLVWGFGPWDLGFGLVIWDRLCGAARSLARQRNAWVNVDRVGAARALGFV